MSATRRFDCPTCGRAVTLAVAELEAKRGWCERCQARFELGEASRLSDVPARAQVPAETALVPAAPSRRTLSLRSKAPLEVVLRNPRSLAATAAGYGVLALVATAMLGVACLVMGAPLLGIMLATLVTTMVVAGLGAVARASLPPPQRLRIEGRQLTLRSFGRPARRLRLDGATDLAVSSALIVSNDRGAVAVGAGLDLSPDELRWLQLAVRAAARPPADGDA
jgi:hypothetical protein